MDISNYGLDRNNQGLYQYRIIEGSQVVYQKDIIYFVCVK